MKKSEIYTFVIKLLNIKALKGGKNRIKAASSSVVSDERDLAFGLPNPEFQKKTETSNFCTEPLVSEPDSRESSFSSRN